ncbi:hypothetical protein [Micromonospora sp. CP22]|uniref:hypothetical protein n=1 Tax=Micromonospora sp. CP22 TaxID=2580517 RepID=UPI0013211ABE|nr:hypothetical protein [Micromonospora sp. CP22]MTK03783.1 hypothetical protein [Micromonospora sp. CP22]
MNQPDDATQALPTQRVPAEPSVTLPAHPPSGPAPTMSWGATEPTVSLGRAEPTMAMGGAEPTMALGGGEATVSWGGGEPTTAMGRAEPTVAMGGGRSTTPWGGDEATMSSGGAEPTTASGGGRSTTAWGGGGAPTASWAGTADVTRTGNAPAPTSVGGGEVRFGPGVPVAPPEAPAWPVAAPPPRRPSTLRRLTAVLSGVLSLALLVVAGLWIWQRLSPLEITEVTASVPRPAGERCDVTVDVVATVSTNGRAGVIEYQWLRTGSAPGALLTERVGWGQRSVELTLRWSFTGVGSTTETATVNIVSPAPVQAATEVSYTCPG